MRKHIISYILSAACALSACSTDFFEPDAPTQFPGDDEILSLTVSASQPVAHDGISSRAKNDDDVLYTEFEAGDSIGVIVMDAAGNILVDNVPFRYDGTNWIFDADKDGKGEITWQYTYRGVTFHGKRDIPATPSGTRLSSSDTGYMGPLPGPKMEFSDFYCSKDTLGQRIGYVLP